ncbi:MAG: UDP-N-acetylmuramate--L-alanine ligase [Planctomycetota bacterium]
MGSSVHLVGVGGTGMCAVASFLLEQGVKVSGSDRGDTAHLKTLVDKGLRLFSRHDSSNVGPETGELVYSVAVPHDSPELVEARRQGLKLLKYAEKVGEILSARRGFCVAGTHGKTTTSSMAAHILREAGKDPSFIIGAGVPQLEGSSHCGGEVFVLESCEFDRSFHNYRPERAIITNVDLDHLDYYRDLAEIRDSFRVFASQVGPGLLLVNGDDPTWKEWAPHAKSYGFGPTCDFRIESPAPRVGRIWRQGKLLMEFELFLPGSHNILNAAAAAIQCLDLGVEAKVIAGSLKGFRGAERRFQVLCENADRTVIDDYAHHPVEIEAVLSMVHERYPGHKVVVVFQPHQHSRTRFLMEAFAEVLSKFDLTIIPNIYFVRESEELRREVTAGNLVAAIARHGGQAVHLSDEAAIAALAHSAGTPRVVLVMGAGDIWKLGRGLCG